MSVPDRQTVRKPSEHRILKQQRGGSAAAWLLRPSPNITLTIPPLISLYPANHRLHPVSLLTQFPGRHQTGPSSFTVKYQYLIPQKTDSLFQLFIGNADCSFQMKLSEFPRLSQINHHIAFPEQIGIDFPWGNGFKLHTFTFYSIVI